MSLKVIKLLFSLKKWKKKEKNYRGLNVTSGLMSWSLPCQGYRFGLRCLWLAKQNLVSAFGAWGSLQSQYFAMDSREQLSLTHSVQFLEQFLRLLRTFCCEFIYAPRRTSLQLKLISRSISAITKCSLLPVVCELPKKTQGENLIAVRLRFYCCFKYFAYCSSDGQGCWRTGRVSHTWVS